MKLARRVPDADEFFIGWLPMPRRYTALLLPVGAVLLTAAVALAVAFAGQQQSPGTAVWDSDSSLALEGIVYAAPYAMLRVPGEKPSDAPRTILLVDEGKFGAVERVAAWDGRPVRVHGSLLHRDERWMLELAAGETGVQPAPAMPLELQAELRRPPSRAMGVVTLAGEIIDAKCYLGAMKPGGGKTHKGCAALCLAGGVPAMLVTRDSNQKESFYLLTSPDGGPVAADVIGFVGDPVQVTGTLEQQGDLHVLKIGSGNVRRR